MCTYTYIRTFVHILMHIYSFRIKNICTCFKAAKSVCSSANMPPDSCASDHWDWHAKTTGLQASKHETLWDSQRVHSGSARRFLLELAGRWLMRVLTLQAPQSRNPQEARLPTATSSFKMLQACLLGQRRRASNPLSQRVQIPTY